MTPEPFQYSVLRVVPQIERAEFMNVGVILFCRTKRFLEARIALDPGRLHALSPGFDVDAVALHLDARVRIAAGERDAGPVAALPQSERFHWLAAPSSTVIQASPTHSGLCEDPEQTLTRLMHALVSVNGQ
jgi:hypothetical protein